MGFFGKALGSFGLKNNNPNPANNAMSYLDRVPGIGRQYLEPYIGQGREGEAMARGNYDVIDSLYSSSPDLYSNTELDPEYGAMGHDPAAFLDRLQKSYTPSAGYKYKEKQLRDSMSNTAAEGGFRGTQADEARRAEATSGILSQDMQQFLENVLGIKGQGLAGLERMLAGRERFQERQLGGRERAFTGKADLERERGSRGYDAAKELASLLSGNTASQAGLGFQGQRQVNTYRDTARDNRLNLLSAGLGMAGTAPQAGSLLAKFL
jgi:hypothetical protein